MGVSLMQLRGRVRSQLGIPQSDQFFRDEVLDDYINLAQDIVGSEHNGPWDQVTAEVVAEDGVIFLPANWRTTRALWFNNEQIINIAPSDPRMRFDTGGAGVAPMYWAEFGSQLRVTPASAGESGPIRLDYYSKVTPLTRDEDGLRMPEQFAGSVISKACELLSLREDNAGAVERHAASYAQWLARMRRSLRRSTGPIVPRVREGSWIG